jgi:16S rRNA (adenine1518-N6/adenine1519-N6)-dimethyltransferase
LKIPLPAHPKHKLGQNFLTDANIIAKILALFAPNPEDHVLEIGAGTGALTLHLAPLVERLIAVEIDSLLIPALEAIENVEVLHQDIMKTDLLTLKKDKPLRVVGNLPYYISTAVVLHLIQQRDAVQDMMLMFQDEVAHRIISPPSNGEYGYLSVLAQYFCTIEAGFRISRNSFFPRPQIESRVLRFQFRRELPLAFDELSAFVAIAFSQRRKKLRNNLLRELNVEPERLDRVFQQLGISETARAENLSPAQFESLILELR